METDQPITERAKTSRFSVVYDRVMPDTKCTLGDRSIVMPMDKFYRLCTVYPASVLRKFVERRVSP